MTRVLGWTTLLGLFFFAISTGGCGRNAVPCGPSSCTGCCDSAGQCQSLPSVSACGSSGAACVQCGAGQTCSFGSCSGPFGTGGGVSGSGGGSSGGSGGAGGAAGGAVGGGAAGGAFAGGTGGGASGGDVADGGVFGGGFATAGGTAGATPADVMFLVDMSGSMNVPMNPAEPTCGSCSGSMCPATCPTRISTLREALGAFVQANSTAARYGLTTFPANNPAFNPTGCAPADAQLVAMLAPTTPDSMGTLNSQANAVRMAVTGLGSTTPATGGTPTADSLGFVRSVPALASSSGRPRGVILVTDGLPNCNPGNPLSCSSMPPPPADLCTIGNSCVGPYCRAGYLDQVATVQAVTALRLAGVRVAVIVLTDALPSQIVSVMNAMADEGGATACPVTSPGCTQRFFATNSRALLATALSAALQRVSAP
ncbi:MAG: VWA domain-containing protein [Myxococcaceae bacterium]|nr:VWA domain-containing protein [Myxococcaceae bacterium]